MHNDQNQKKTIFQVFFVNNFFLYIIFQVKKTRYLSLLFLVYLNYEIIYTGYFQTANIHSVFLFQPNVHNRLIK